MRISTQTAAAFLSVCLPSLAKGALLRLISLDLPTGLLALFVELLPIYIQACFGPPGGKKGRHVQIS